MFVAAPYLAKILDGSWTTLCTPHTSHNPCFGLQFGSKYLPAGFEVQLLSNVVTGFNEDPGVPRLLDGVEVQELCNDLRRAIRSFNWQVPQSHAALPLWIHRLYLWQQDLVSHDLLSAVEKRKLYSIQTLIETVLHRNPYSLQNCNAGRCCPRDHGLGQEHG